MPHDATSPPPVTSPEYLPWLVHNGGGQAAPPPASPPAAPPKAPLPPVGTQSASGAQGNYIAQNLTREGFATEQQILEQGGVMLRQGFYVLPNGTAFEFVPNQGWRFDATPYLTTQDKQAVVRLLQAQQNPAAALGSQPIAQAPARPQLTPNALN